MIVMGLMMGMVRVRTSRVWNGLLTAFGAALSLVAALMLSLEAYWRALQPEKMFSCDIDEKLSCSTVADSWQSQVIQLPDGPVPNAFLGIAAFTVILVLGVVYACRFRAPAWFNWCFRVGVALALAASTWLLVQSVFVIKAMCPWCLTMDVGMMVSTIGMLRLWATEPVLDDGHGTLNRFFKFTAGMESLLVEVLILLAFGLGVFLYWAF